MTSLLVLRGAVAARVGAGERGVSARSPAAYYNVIYMCFHYIISIICYACVYTYIYIYIYIYILLNMHELYIHYSLYVMCIYIYIYALNGHQRGSMILH